MIEPLILSHAFYPYKKCMMLYTSCKRGFFGIYTGMCIVLKSKIYF